MAAGLEFDGKNVERAVQKACEKLHIKKDKLKYDVISYGSTGIFGLVGTKKARIRVIVPEGKSKPRPKSEPERKALPAAKADLDVSAVAEPFEAEIQAEGPVEQLVETQAEEPVEKQMISTVAESSSLPVIRQEDANADDSQPQAEVEAAYELGHQALQRMVDLISGDATISLEKSGNRLTFKVTGGNAGLLIGKRGQTLEAIQYLLDKIINKANEKRIRIHVDIEGYLESKQDKLKNLAIRLAEKVKKTGKPMAMGPMNAHDRRVVHMTLKDDQIVRTQSLGDGHYRKLMIFPRKNSIQKKEDKPD